MDIQHDDVLIELETCDTQPARGPHIVSTAEHAFRLSEAVAELGSSSASDWLRLAAGVVAVEINLQSYDTSIFMCGSAFEYYGAHSFVASMMARELTRFLYIWASLENLVYVSDNRPRSPTIRKLLDEYETQFARPLHFDCNAFHLKDCLIRRSRAFKQCRDDFDEDYGKTASSVFAFITKLRNALVHGAMQQASAPKWGGEPSTELSVLTCAQRLTLFTIQMLLLLRHSDEELYARNLDGDKADMPASEVLPYIHWEDFS
jgi:hypothetical protein